MFKYKQMQFFSVNLHHKKYSNMGVAPNYVMNNILLEEIKEIKDFGVFYDTLLVFDKHICEKINKAYMMLSIIKRNFTCISRKCFIILYKSVMDELRYVTLTLLIFRLYPVS